MNNYCNALDLLPVWICSLGAMQYDVLSLTRISKQWTTRRSQYIHSILFHVDEQRSNALIPSCTLLLVQTHNVFWRNGKGGKGAGAKSNMFSSIKYLFFLKTPPKARRSTETRINDKKSEGYLSTYWKSNNKIRFPPKLKDSESSDEEGPGWPSHHYVTSIYISGTEMSPVLATGAAIIPSTGNSQLFFFFASYCLYNNGLIAHIHPGNALDKTELHLDLFPNVTRQIARY